jgi:ribose transport system substrate-binding protein
MSGNIFINYRRDDASYPAGRLYDRLSAHFPKNQIFIDVDNLDPGIDFVEAIEQSVGSCDVLIAVIGKRWLISSEAEGSRRLDNPDDFVRLEIATALKRNIRVIPVLVDDASMPRANDLPDDLKSLVRRQAIPVSHDRFSADSERLIAALDRVFQKTAAEQGEREEKARLEAELKDRLEEERQQKEKRDRLEAEQREKDRLEAEKSERERLEAERREHEKKERPEHVPQSQPPAPVVPSTSSPKCEPDKPAAETPKVIPPKLSEPERVKSPAPSLGGTGGKSPWKQVIALLAIAAVLVVGGFIYFAIRASQSSSPQPAPLAAATPRPPAIATPTVEEKAPLEPQVVVQPTTQPTEPVAVAVPSPSLSTTPILTPFAAKFLSQAKRYLDAEEFAKALPLLQKAADGGKTALAARNKYTIALIPGLTTDAFYIMMREGAKAAAKALDVDLIFEGAPEFNPVEQVPVLNAVAARNPSAILIAPTDKVQLVEPLKKAFQAGIPVITVDTFIGNGRYQTGTGDADFPLSCIASDNILGGEIAARALAKAIGDKGKVYVSSVRPGFWVIDQREQGFKEEMKKHPNITVLETQFNDDDANKAASQFESVLARNPDLAAVFGANLFSAIGASVGAKQAGATGKVKVVAFDAPASLVPEIKDGRVDIAIAQHPGDIGFFGVVAAYAHLTGQSIPPLIGTRFTVIDKANVDDPNVKRFVYSD